MKKILNSELGRPSLTEYQLLEKLPVVVIADNIRSLHNIGAMFRTMDAFSFEKLYLCGISGTPPNKEIHKSALGAELSVEWEYHKDTSALVAALKEDGYTIISVEQVEGAVMLDSLEIDYSRRYALVLGNEVNGVSQSVVDSSDLCVEIPQRGTKHSLNVSVAAGVVMWHIFSNFNR